ncbi:alpha/beta hydrolase [Sphingosinicella sp. LHD-64]|uniref:alpha/beta fold hydrolase n=1 Tax=Sphingosinicella sp. LHD-64 TaxID=3072139 RepID=UPI00280FACDA|nr:alpha/beta hydrolase [Sphingosinicella sp. LHD-64]MDQ8756782.1 alpha/beta hydrolase [Sphingosinicella sp. LHD-64]
MPGFTASDGAWIAYRDTAPSGGAGTPLVLLHGLMAHGGFFREQAPLADGFRLVTLDLRGHGDSAAGAATATVERMAADVAELVIALDLKDAIGVGWSLGATVLWHVLAGPAAARFVGSVVIDMTARVRNDAEWDLGLSPEACEARSAAIRDDFDSFARGAGQGIFAQPVPAHLQDAAEWAGVEFARSDPEAIAAVWASLVRQDVRTLLSRIAHPTLIVHGGQSRLYGDDTADHLVAALPDARSVRFDASGHAPHLEAPEAFNRTLRDFAARLSCARNPETTN